MGKDRRSVHNPPIHLKYPLLLNCTVVLPSRGLATTELEIHPISAYTHAVSSLVSLHVCGLTHHFKFPCHRILVEGKWETVFLLSGDDLKVHLYREEWRLSEVCVCAWEKYFSNCDP